jgi:hypothetical protein
MLTRIGLPMNPKLEISLQQWEKLQTRLSQVVLLMQGEPSQAMLPATNAPASLPLDSTGYCNVALAAACNVWWKVAFLSVDGGQFASWYSHFLELGVIEATVAMLNDTAHAGTVGTGGAGSMASMENDKGTGVAGGFQLISMISFQVRVIDMNEKTITLITEYSKRCINAGYVEFVHQMMESYSNLPSPATAHQEIVPMVASFLTICEDPEMAKAVVVRLAACPGGVAAFRQHGARFPSEIYTRGCHWISHLCSA